MNYTIPRQLVVLLVTWCCLMLGHVRSQSDVTRASCVVAPDSGVFPIQGRINITQPSAGGAVTIYIYLTGFNTSSPGLHGFHVHANSNLSEKCNAAGGHYNPQNVVHGAPNDTIRHVGDLGNVYSDVNGVVNTTITDNIVSLIGQYSVINKAIVVHGGEDDLGRGGYTDSNTTGHAGPRYGCCVITLDSVASSTTPVSTTPRSAASHLTSGLLLQLIAMLLVAMTMTVS